MKAIDFRKPTGKYGNRKQGGYDSGREKRRATDLHYLQKAGEISSLQEQVAFELVPSQYAVVNGKRKCVEQSVKYVADFVYVDRQGNTVVEDTKGVKTKDYIIKRKLMLHVHGIMVVEK